MSAIYRVEQGKVTMKIIYGLLLFTACTKPKVSFETAEESRKTARENSGALAKTYRAEAKLDEFDIMMKGDSSITNECPQGDGWASIELVNRKTNEVLKLKCSTVSAGIGCMPEADFKQRAQYANKEGNCDKDIPFPLPKVMQ